MADAVVTMGARWDGAALKRGVEDTKKSILSATKAIQGPLGFLGITTAALTFGKAIRDIADEQRTMDRLVGTMERLTGQAPNMQALNFELARLRRESIFGDTELASTMQQLVQLTNDYSGSLRNLSLVTDIASSTGKSLRETVRLVGFAMKGITEPLNEISPLIRQWSVENSELIGTSKGAAEALGILYDQFGGARIDEIKGAAGAWHVFTTGMSELRDALMEAATEGSGPFGMWMKRAGDYLLYLAEANRAARASQALMREMGQPYDSLPGELGPSPFSLTAADAEAAANEESARLLEQMDTFKENMARNTRELAEQEREATRAAQARLDLYEELRETAKEVAIRINETINERRMKDQEEREALRMQHVSELQSAFAGAFMSIRSGWEGLIDYMQQYMMQKLAWWIAGKFATALFPGAGPGLAGGGLIDGPGIPGMSVGASRAVMQQNAWRMQRSLR